MQVIVHAGQQREAFKVDGKLLRVAEDKPSFVTLNIRQPGESIVDGVCFILESPAKMRDLILQLVEVCERLQAEEIAEQDAALRAKIHAVLDARVALKARGQAEKEYVPVPATDQELEAAGLPAPAPVSYADDDDEVPF